MFFSVGAKHYITRTSTPVQAVYAELSRRVHRFFGKTRWIDRVEAIMLRRTPKLVAVRVITKEEADGSD
jgi:hypothetical protein